LRYVWDRGKSDNNLRARGFDFAFATLIFSGVCLVTEDARRDYGERRLVAIGLADGRHLTVVFTDRIARDGEVVRRIISARLSNRRERERHEQAAAGQPPAQPRTRGPAPPGAPDGN